MRAAALLVLLALGPVEGPPRAVQDEAAIRGWIRDLDDDAPAVRDRAAASLLENADVSEPWLRRAAEEGAEEQRARAADLLLAIGRKRQIEPAPSRISLLAEQMPFRDVVAALRCQSLTPLDDSELSDELAERPVTLDLRDVSVFDAVHAAVRAHGGVRANVEFDDEDGGPVVYLSEGRPAEPPRTTRGPYEIRLESIELTREVRPGGGIDDRTGFVFSWAFERGVRPLGASVELSELRDDRGASWLERLAPVEESPFFHEYLARQLETEFPAIPPEPASRFAIVRGDLVVRLPTAVERVDFDRPAGRVGAQRRAGPCHLKLLSWKVEEDEIEVQVEIRPAALGSRLRIELLDAAGKAFDGRQATTSESEDEDSALDQSTFTLDPARVPALLRCTIPTGTRERRIPFEFRDVRFR
jgi:hypothetical protein